MFVGTRGDLTCLSFSFLYQYSWAHEEIMLASLFCFRIDLCRHTRRLWLPFFSYWFNLHYMVFLSDRSLLAHITGVSSLLQYFGWDDQSLYFIVPVSYWCTISTRSHRWWIICLTYTWNLSRVIFLLNFGLASLPLIVKDGYDKPSKCWRSLYVVGRTWDNLTSI